MDEKQRGDKARLEDEKRLEPTSAWWQRLVELAALVALPPALAYALGVVALWVQLSNVYLFSDGWTFWQAATMATKPVVAGFGVGIMLRALTFSVLLSAIVLLAWWLFEFFYRKKTSYPFAWSLPLTSLTVGMALLLLGGIFGNSPVPTVPILRTVGVPIALYLLLLCLPWFLGPAQRFVVSQIFAFYPRILYAIISVVAVAFTVLSTLLPGDLELLPCLTRQLDEGYEQTEGRLVALADGYWWVFDENGRFTAIPNDDTARMIVEDPRDGPPSPRESSYSGPYVDDPSNPIQECR